ncbi:MAG: universal stress protein [Bryobacteraceae bacterium]|jgi:nucleotide-binding universal stress UspA family protein
MAWLSRILAPVDFSPRCRGATEYAETLSCHFHSELILLHVVAPPVALYAAPEAMAYSTASELTVERLEQRKIELGAYLGGQCPDIPLAQEVVEGDPAREIVDYARGHDVDLIVMATHGYGPFRRFLLGSVTAKVLHDAGCPVWTGPHLEDAPSYQTIGFRSIVCAIDLAKGSRAVLEWAGRFAQEYGAELAIVHVLPESLVHWGGVYFDPEWRSQAAAAARDQIVRLQQELYPAVEVLIEIGDVPVVVSDVASRRKADLLVIGRGRDSGLLGRLRANAYAILRESPCPVVTI